MKKIFAKIAAFTLIELIIATALISIVIFGIASSTNMLNNNSQDYGQRYAVTASTQTAVNHMLNNAAQAVGSSKANDEAILIGSTTGSSLVTGNPGDANAGNTFCIHQQPNGVDSWLCYSYEAAGNQMYQVNWCNETYVPGQDPRGATSCDYAATHSGVKQNFLGTATSLPTTSFKNGLFSVTIQNALNNAAASSSSNPSFTKTSSIRAAGVSLCPPSQVVCGVCGGCSSSQTCVGNQCLSNCSSETVISGGASVTIPGTGSGTSSSQACPSGYSGSLTAACTNGSWAAFTGSCSPDACAIANTVVSNGASVTFPAGTASGVTVPEPCPAGYSGTLSDLCSLGSWAAFTGSCAPNACAAANTVVSNGASVTFPAGTASGTTVPEVCPAGYTGTLSDLCSLGSWAAYTGTCSPNACATANTVVSNGASVTFPAGTASGVTVPEACPAGYSGTLSDKCLLGTWQAFTGSCTANPCATANTVNSNGASVTFPAGTASGTTVPEVCPAGYSGTLSDLCTAGSWAAFTGSCTVSPCATANTVVSNGASVTFPAGTSSGTTVPEACPAGYTGTLSDECLLSVWQPFTGSCTASPCATANTVVSNGASVTFPAGTASGVTVPEVCPAGYTGTLSDKCLLGAWQVFTGSCAADPCSSANTVNSNGASVTFPAGTASGTTVPEVCPGGYTGTLSDLCSLGSWAAFTGSCTASPCATANTVNSNGASVTFPAGTTSGTTVPEVCPGGYTGTLSDLCSLGSWAAFTGTCAPNVNCVGSWGACTSSCSQTYTITTPASGSGSPCPDANGATQACANGTVCGTGEVCESGSCGCYQCTNESCHSVVASGGSCTTLDCEGPFLNSTAYLTAAPTISSVPSCSGTCSYGTCGSGCAGFCNAPAVWTSCSFGSWAGCSSGPTCSAGYTNCNGTCVDEQADPNNCGSCGVTCGGCSCNSGNCIYPDYCGICGGSSYAKYTVTTLPCTPSFNCGSGNSCVCGWNNSEGSTGQSNTCTPGSSPSGYSSCSGPEGSSNCPSGGWEEISCTTNCISGCNPGCDGVCNSGKTVDACGYCGGSVSSCPSGCCSLDTCLSSCSSCVNGPASNVGSGTICCSSGPSLATCGTISYCPGTGNDTLHCCCASSGETPTVYWVTNQPCSDGANGENC